MEHPILTPAKILTILQKAEATQDVRIVTSDVKAGTEKGQNYSGQVLECQVEALVQGQSRSYHWMAKLPQDDPTKFLWGRAGRMEEKEIRFYDDLVPSFEKFIAQKGASIKLNYCPIVHAEFDPDVVQEECQKGSMLIMDHMKQHNYQDAINKREGLDLDHVKLVMEELAKLHAVSYAFFKEKHGTTEDMMNKETIYARDFVFAYPEPAMMAAMEGFDKGADELMLDTLGNCGQACKDSFQRYLDGGGDPTKQRNLLFSNKEYKFNTLCHGDSWFNNMLFRYNEQGKTPKPDKVCLLDMAIIRWCSPTTDLAYFIYLSTTPELRKAHMNEILEYYHAQLIQCLCALGEDPTVYPLAELKTDYRKASFAGFAMSLAFLPWMLSPKEDAIGSEDFSGDFTDETVLKEMQEMTKRHMNKMAEKHPAIFDRIRGAFMDMVELGHFKL
eukprot:maker-scaffold664_size116482-snap-gene-0.21 protein:Tk03079 transcript:maker-scaffold664_size116482-snap-gene-0.21-mRNA-1 annotation:"AGAP013467-PA"